MCLVSMKAFILAMFWSMLTANPIDMIKYVHNFVLLWCAVVIFELPVYPYYLSIRILQRCFSDTGANVFFQDCNSPISQRFSPSGEQPEQHVIFQIWRSSRHSRLPHRGAHYSTEQVPSDRHVWGQSSKMLPCTYSQLRLSVFSYISIM